ncbi:GH25 family lysozyme, partial [Streptococcus suis]
LGYSNLIHYTGASWLDDNSLGVVGPIQTSQFGMTNFWVAQYPYSTMTPAQAMSMSLHARTAAWQYTSKATLLPGRSFFDVNLDYTNRFTK